jgi:hypothetical protein
MSKSTVTITTEIDLDVKTGAAWFAGLDDEQQAQFFIEVAAVAKTWGGAGPYYQWFSVGRHLRTCECSTPDARELIEAMSEGLSPEAAQEAA